MFRILYPDSELGTQLSEFLKEKSGENQMEIKFTERQYRKIVEAADEYLERNLLINDSGILQDNRSIWSMLDNSGFFARREMLKNYDQEIMAIANPITREWAYDQFVEKEKVYLWTSKKENSDGDCMVLFKVPDSDGILNDFKSKAKPTPIAESEIREWGFDPDMFYRRMRYEDCLK